MEKFITPHYRTYCQLFFSDKMCDQISDAILDAHLKEDPDAKVACETVTKTGMIMVRHFVKTPANILHNVTDTGTDIH